MLPSGCGISLACRWYVCVCVLFALRMPSCVMLCATQLRVTIAPNSQGVRGVIATEDVRKGEFLLEIPQQIIFSVHYAAAAVGIPPARAAAAAAERACVCARA